NEIEEISGLQNCHRLTHLGLSHNRIRAVAGLENLPIRILDLSSNRLQTVRGLRALPQLQRVDLSCNEIRSLRGLQGHGLLESIDLQDNRVAELRELRWIRDLPLLRSLNLLKNPIQVAAVNRRDPPLEVEASEDHRTQLLYGFLQPHRVLDTSVPSIYGGFPQKFIPNSPVNIMGPCHTSRAPYFGEQRGLDFHFIDAEEFEEMQRAGQFLLTYDLWGHRYGLAKDTVESIARAGLATCVTMEME
ncbi:leucine-rich repeat and guanylate kinase domain-containing protein-like, partial [Malurus melanocephalus]|uniref:leucine-rich repeat and guanylate kinase domain-containing protein-like n=1 Tax=Malurus melanocephalus TaxID=175006 RepID=UPI002546D2BF